VVNGQACHTLVQQVYSVPTDTSKIQFCVAVLETFTTTQSHIIIPVLDLNFLLLMQNKYDKTLQRAKLVTDCCTLLLAM
jgi:acetone carboxylase gamma subunit